VGSDNVQGTTIVRGGFLKLEGAVVVVAGASSGIGEASAVAFAKEGARVVLAARRTERLDAIVERIEKAGGRALAATCDVTRPDRLDTLRVVTEEAFGPTDVLVNSAGVRGGGEFTKLGFDRIEDHVRVNVLGVMFGTRAFLPGMLARGTGHVVNIGSLAGRFATPGNAIYGATKHAVVAFSEAMNYETEGRNVRVTSVNPAFVDTEGFPQGDLPDWAVLEMGTVTDAIVKVVRQDIAPELSVPRWLSPLQLFRVATPPLYRWAMRRARRSRRSHPPDR
jgi:NADP-dependent 3-hydroxy acid dehydrogenase YdfG